MSRTVKSLLGGSGKSASQKYYEKLAATYTSNPAEFMSYWQNIQNSPIEKLPQGKGMLKDSYPRFLKAQAPVALNIASSINTRNPSPRQHIFQRNLSAISGVKRQSKKRRGLMASVLTRGVSLGTASISTQKAKRLGRSGY